VENDDTGRKRQAFVDDLTSAQLDFIFLAKQERELMKQENAERQQSKQQMKHNY
jgi:hypothetical protein